MKLHLVSTNDKNLTVCGGRISGTKSTGRKQFFDASLELFEKYPKDQCSKCALHLHELKEKTK
jgi:hypothetical protein